MSENNIVRIMHDVDVMRAHQQAIEQIDYFKMRFKENKDGETMFIVKVGFSVNRKDKSPVIPITTIEEKNEKSKNNDKKVKKLEKKDIDTEWMWVTLRNWKGINIEGTINNEPAYRKDLNFGTIVEFPEKAIMDWIIAKDGQISEGNFLHKILKLKGKPIN